LSIEAWIEKNIEKLKVIVIQVFAQVSKTTITIVFDEDCAKCLEENKMKDCFIPFLTSAGRVRMFLLLILDSVFYNEMKMIGFEEIIRAQLWASVATLHMEFHNWKVANCKDAKNKEKKKADSYVT
jgi:hypothetical protein